jgi:hypothetical protein
VLQLAADGLSWTAIAEALVVSPGTVKSTFRTSTPRSARATGLRLWRSGFGAGCSLNLCIRVFDRSMGRYAGTGR